MHLWLWIMVLFIKYSVAPGVHWYCNIFFTTGQLNNISHMPIQWKTMQTLCYPNKYIQKLRAGTESKLWIGKTNIQVNLTSEINVCKRLQSKLGISVFMWSVCFVFNYKADAMLSSTYQYYAAHDKLWHFLCKLPM